MTSRHSFSRPRRRTPSVAVPLALACSLFATGGTAFAQGFVPGPYLADPNCPPFVFVTMSDSLSGFGTDAAQDDSLGGELDLGSPGRELWFMDQHRSQPVLLFPLTSNTYASGLHLPASSDLSKGSVHEPAIYHFRDENASAGNEDRYWVIFSFALDLTTRDIRLPCDLFAMDISDAINSPTTFNASSVPTLPLVRLTDSVGTMTQQSAVAQDIYDRAFNSELAPQFSYLNGVAWQGVGGINLHYETNSGACVVDEEHGPVLYYASNQRRTDGQGMLAADLHYENGLLSLLDKREIQHFGTTSMTSMFATPRGAGGSYRSSTESVNQWGIFEFRSDEAEWQTISGYADPINFADHNATTVAWGDDPDESLIAISRYYVGNNESFGTIVVIRYGDAGLNEDDGQTDIHQVGAFSTGSGTVANMFTDVDEFEDLGAHPRSIPPLPTDGSIGKFAHPAGGRCGTSRSDVQLFLTYSPMSSHGAGTYDAKLVVVTDMSAPIAAVSNSYLPASPPPNYPVQLVLEHPSKHCFAMRPVLSDSERFGYSLREAKPLHPRAEFAGAPQLDGMPVAKVIAGPIYDTDIRSLARRRVEQPSADFYDPTTENRNNATAGTHHEFSRVASLTKDLASVTHDDVWGVRIYITDAKVRRLMNPQHDYDPLMPLTANNPPIWGYLHHDGVGGQEWGAPYHFERYRHLSDVKADDEGKVNFLLPANVPVKFMLLANDGTVLAAHRNHHSFAPGQIEQRCTGCHQHVSPTPGPAASLSSAFDTVTQTGKWERTSSGAMAFNVYSDDSLRVPEFRKDIWPLLLDHCASCHDTAHTNYPDPHDGTGAFNLSRPRDELYNGVLVTMEKEAAVWAWLNRQRIVNRRAGAAKSPFTWYFTGINTDQDIRLDGETNARYMQAYNPNANAGSRYWITTHHQGTKVHPTAMISDRTAIGTVIEWIDGGAGITHNAVIPDGSGGWINDPRRGLNGDGYQIGISANLTTFNGTALEVGYWDAFDNIDTVTVSVNGAALAPYSPTSNGTKVFQLGTPPALDDVIAIDVVDDEGNRSDLQKTYRQLVLESEPHRGEVTIAATQHTYTGSQTVTFAIDAPAHPGAWHFIAIGEGIHPGTDVRPQNLGLFLLPNDGAWLQSSIGLGAQGPLNGSGAGTFSFPLPPGPLPAYDLYCVSGVLAASGLYAKSNIERIRIR